MTEEQIRKLVDERTRHSKQTFTKHFSDVPDDLSLIILKGHLLVERRLNAIIAHHVRPSADLAAVGLRFPQKVALARALVATENFFPPEFWSFAKLLNQLRNDFAHELEPPKLETHLNLARKMATAAFRKAFDPKSFSMPNTDEGKLKMLIALWLGVLDPVDALTHALEKSKTYDAKLPQLIRLLRDRCKIPDGLPDLPQTAGAPSPGTDNR